MAKKYKNRAKIWFLLDRSGSMASVAENVIRGFNYFLTEQASLQRVSVHDGGIRRGRRVLLGAWSYP